MSTRAPGFYWVQWQVGGKPSAVHPATIAYWNDSYWSGCGGDQDTYTWEDSEPTAEHNAYAVLAGPLQAPTEIPLRDERLASLDAEFVAATTRPDGSVDYAASRPVKADLSGWAGPLVSGEENWARARIATLKRRARALLEGTTPGPWSRDGCGEDIVAPHQHDRYCTPGHSAGLGRPTTIIETDSGRYVYNDRDHEMIVGAHALLTELAKEES